MIINNLAHNERRDNDSRKFNPSTQDGLTPRLYKVIAQFQEYLHLPDPTPLLVTLATVAANRMPGDPIWLLLIGASGSGKTEILNSILELPNMHSASTLTEAGLLSGTSAREKSTDATGGLLCEIGNFGILVLKDFTSVLSMNRDQRATVLAALREIFDGSWTRRLGVDGGRKLSWTGKLGLLAGCTDAIELHHEVIASMGDRYLRLRMPEINPEEQGLRSQANIGREVEMRHKLEASVTDFFSELDLATGVTVKDEGAHRINCLATFTAMARSSVQRNVYGGREIEFVPDPEMPARLSKSLLSLYAGLIKIGVSPEFAVKCIDQVAFDCIPKVRRSLVQELIRSTDQLTVADFAKATRLPDSTIRRRLEDLQALNVLEDRQPKGDTYTQHSEGGAIALGLGNARVWVFTGVASILLGDAGIL
jgi:hypothetical protein